MIDGYEADLKRLLTVLVDPATKSRQYTHFLFGSLASRKLIIVDV